MPLYRNILKQSLATIWRNKYLWFFGFFAAFMGSFLELELLFNKTNASFAQNFLSRLQTMKETGIFSSQALSNLGNLFKTEPISMVIMLTIFLIVIVLLGFLIWLSIISQAGLVNNTSQIFQSGSKTKSKLGIQEGVETGIRSFWRVLGINLIIKALLYLIFLCLSFLIFFITYQSGLSGGAGIINMFLFVIFIPVALVLAFIAKYAICFTVIKKKSFKDSVKNAFQLFRRNWLVSIEMAFILFFISFLFSLAILIGSVIVTLPILLVLNIAVALSWPMFSFWVFIFGIIVLAVFIAVTGAALSAFRITAWTNLFVKLNSSQGGVSKILRLADNFKAKK